jgi:hypothetical protein
LLKKCRLQETAYGIFKSALSSNWASCIAANGVLPEPGSDFQGIQVIWCFSFLCGGKSHALSSSQSFISGFDPGFDGYFACGHGRSSCSCRQGADPE